MSHNNQKKIAIINDISGFGRCSVAVAMPIISYMGIQACPIPTSIFSNHTGYSEYFFDDYTDKMEEYISYWKKLDLRFNAIMTGFLGSKKQIDIVKNFILDFKEEKTLIIIDPAMGEGGKPYKTYTSDMCNEMKKLVSLADIITPNVTEACILTDSEYKHSDWSREELFLISDKLISMGAKKVVISGVDMGEYVGNIINDKINGPKILKHKKAGEFRSGTGDIYASIIASDLVNGVSFERSVLKAGEFVRKCIEVTDDLNIPKTDGLAFEEVLYTIERR